MAHPKKYSRTITVGDQTYRWRIAINDDEPWIKSIAIYGDGVLHSAELRLSVELPSITPNLIRRVILLGLNFGFDAHVQSTTRWLTSEQIDEVDHVHPHYLSHEGHPYVWTPDFKGGLHMKIRSAASADGQLLATLSTLHLKQLTDPIATQFIAAGLKAGWLPDLTGGDCIWLSKTVCDQIVSAATSETTNTGRMGINPYRCGQK